MAPRFRLSRIASLLAIAVVATFTGFAEESGADDAAPLRFNENGWPHLDPARYAAGRMCDERLLIALLEPLTTLDPETGSAKPGAATSWSQGSDPRTWTFHLRRTARWSDGSPVTSADFVRSWKRTLERGRSSGQVSPWIELLFALDGTREIIANSARAELFSALRKALDQEIASHQATGIPGERIADLLTELGVRPYLHGVKGRAIQLLANWDVKRSFQAESVKSAGEALRDARKEARDASNDAISQFGNEGSAVWAKDEFTLVLRTDGVVPYLPDLVARGIFAPIHARFESIRDKIFEDAHLFISSGPFHFRGRGARPNVHAPNEPTASLVHLVRSETYDGPNQARTNEVMCLTEQWANESALKREDLLMFDDGRTDHVFCTWSELPPADRKRKEADIRGQYERHEAFRVRPTGTGVYLVFRCDRPPFNSRSAREAFVRLIDTKPLATAFWPPAEPLDRIVPAGIAGRLEGVVRPTTDGAAAKKAFQASGFDLENWFNVSYSGFPGVETVVEQLLRAWEKSFGAEGGDRMEATEAEALKTLRSGSYEAFVLLLRGGADDPAAYLARFHSTNPENGTGWRDEGLDLLLDAAKDPRDALARKADLLKAGGESAALKRAFDGAGSPAGDATLRLELLAAAERRLLEEFVVMPIATLREAELGGRVKGFGTDAAWRKPGFVGALWAVTK